MQIFFSYSGHTKNREYTVSKQIPMLTLQYQFECHYVSLSINTSFGCYMSVIKPTMYQDTEVIKKAVPLASSFNLCTETSNDSLSSSSLSKNAFLSMAWFSLCSKSSNETIVALETKSRILGSSAQLT